MNCPGSNTRGEWIGSDRIRACAICGRQFEGHWVRPHDAVMYHDHAGRVSRETARPPFVRSVPMHVPDRSVRLLTRRFYEMMRLAGLPPEQARRVVIVALGSCGRFATIGQP